MVGSDPNESLLAPDTMLAHYRILAPIGAGAMGTVYEAHDTALDRPVAVKVLRSEISRDEDIVRRFQREARAAARVNHPNLTHIYFVGETEGRHYFAMERLPGRNLEDAITEDGPMELTKALDVLSQAARGLAAAHQAEVIHRDVKPSNIMLLPSGEVKVTDFGLAKSLTGETDVTGDGRVLGTPRYMSPEQCRGQTLDSRSDIYNVGLLGWFLLAGRHPYEGTSVGVVLDEQMNRPLPNLSEHSPDLPKKVQKTLQAIAEKDREDRPADMATAIAMLEDLRPRTLDLAPFTARAAAFALDQLLIFLIFLLGGGGAWLLMVIMGHTEPGPWLLWLGSVINVAVTTFSQFGMERLVGGSPAKLLFNFRVTAKDGGRPETRALAYRFLIRYPIAPLLLLPASVTSLPYVRPVALLLWTVAVLGGALCYALRDRKTLSDVLTGTRVIYRSADQEATTTSTTT